MLYMQLPDLMDLDFEVAYERLSAVTLKNRCLTYVNITNKG